MRNEELVDDLVGAGSMRARVMAKGLTTLLPLLRRGNGGVPDEMTREDAVAYVHRMRPMFDRLAEAGPTLPGTHVTPTRGGPVPGEWITTRKSRMDRVVMHVHGGAYTFCSPATHRGIARGLAQTGHARLYLPDYRLAPEHPFPAALDDVVASYRWLVGREGVSPSRIVVSGDSAGGGLALAMLVVLRDAGDDLPAGYIGMSPWTDLAATGSSLVENADRDALFGQVPDDAMSVLASLYHGDVPADDPLVSPLYADLTGLPPMLVHVGESELIRDDGVRLVERARAVGVDASLGRFAGMWHVFQAFPVPEGVRSMREFGGFIRRVTGNDA